MAILLRPFALGFNPVMDKAALNARICSGNEALWEADGSPWEKQEDETYEPSGVSVCVCVCVFI